MELSRDFYTQMRHAIRRNPDFAEVSPEVWSEFCSEIISEEATTAEVVSKVNNVGDANWEGLQSLVAQCDRCNLRKSCTQTVFGEGNQNAELMFIGEGPAAEDDEQGRPFVGEAGQLLDKMIVAMQFTRESVYIANVVKCRPEGNRTPEEGEVEQCISYLKQQIALVSPKVIVLLGAIPLKYVLNLSGIKKHRGEFLSYENIPVMPTFHPAYLLRSPEDKRLTWNDLKKVMAMLGKTPAAKKG